MHTNIVKRCTVKEKRKKKSESNIDARSFRNVRGFCSRWIYISIGSLCNTSGARGTSFVRAACASFFLIVQANNRLAMFEILAFVEVQLFGSLLKFLFFHWNLESVLAWFLRRINFFRRTYLIILFVFLLLGAVSQIVLVLSIMRYYKFGSVHFNSKG
jgi:hypothetical protein